MPRVPIHDHADINSGGKLRGNALAHGVSVGSTGSTTTTTTSAGSATSGVIVQEVDGSPIGTATTIVVNNGALTFSDGTATVDVSGTVTADIVVNDEGATIGTASVLNFTGVGGTASFSGGTATITIPGLVVQDEGVAVGTASILNIVGAGGTATYAGGTATVTIAGGAGNAGNLTGAYDLEGDGSPTYTDAGMSDEFGSGTLDAQWTAVGASAGTVALLTANPAASVYDLGTRSGTLLVQIDIAGSVAFRQDAVIGDGEQIIVAMAIAGPGDVVNVGNSMWAGIGFNDNDTDYDQGTIRSVFWDGGDDSRIVGINAITPVVFGEVTPAAPPGRRQYFRAARSGTTLYFFWSLDGIVWTPVGTGQTLSTCNNFWVFFDSRGVSYDHAPISAVMWVRHVANTNLDPW